MKGNLLSPLYPFLIYICKPGGTVVKNSINLIYIKVTMTVMRLATITVKLILIETVMLRTIFN